MMYHFKLVIKYDVQLEVKLEITPFGKSEIIFDLL